MPYAVASDLHTHKWSTYATTNADGVNSRLRIILDELLRAAIELQAIGGTTLVIAGDIFHARGILDPEVLNPVQAMFRRILDMGINILMIPGNHDLLGNETTELGSAIQTLAETFSSEGTIRVFNEPILLQDGAGAGNSLAFVPWQSTTEALLKAAGELAAQAARKGFLQETDLIIHAGIDGVLEGMPSHGLTADRLADLGFRNVFSGHYHNHKDLGRGVYSIGATTHQSWRDIDSKAGFLIVQGGKVQYKPSYAPSFIDISGTDPADHPELVRGHYARFRGEEMSSDDIKALREHLNGCGALGVSIQVAKKATTARPTGSAKTGVTIDQSVTGFVDTTTLIPAHVDRNAVKLEAIAVLEKARTTYEEA